MRLLFSLSFFKAIWIKFIVIVTFTLHLLQFRLNSILTIIRARRMESKKQTNKENRFSNAKKKLSKTIEHMKQLTQ